MNRGPPWTENGSRQDINNVTVRTSERDSGAYILIDKQHVNAHKLSGLVDILGFPEPQQADLRSVRASACSQVLKERV